MNKSDADLVPQRIGYARVSSGGQNLDSQCDALQQVGCAKIFTDKMSGSRLDRPAWERLLEYLRPGDTLVVTELSRRPARYSICWRPPNCWSNARSTWCGCGRT